MKVVPVSSAGSRVTKTTNVNTPLFLAHAGRTSAPQSKYADLLVVIEDMGRDIRPTYAGSRMATERLKRGEGALLPNLYIFQKIQTYAFSQSVVGNIFLTLV